jgi:hypothetical protein
MPRSCQPHQHEPRAPDREMRCPVGLRPVVIVPTVNARSGTWPSGVLAERNLEGRSAVRFPVSPDTPCCRADVVGGDLPPPTPPQVEHDCPGEQKDDWDKQDQHKAHHDLLLEMFSAYASCRLGAPTCLARAAAGFLGYGHRVGVVAGPESRKPVPGGCRRGRPSQGGTHGIHGQGA